MPLVGKYFPSQKSQEKVFLLLRRHWFTYFGFVVVGIIMAIPMFALILIWIDRPGYFSGQIGNLAILGVFAYLLFTIGLMLYGFIDYYLDVYIVTNERIVNVEQNGFFKREISELHLHQIQDVSAKVNGFLPTMIHYGDIFIQTAGERENFIFKSIPNPYRVSKLIVDLHEAQLEESLALAEETVNERTPSGSLESDVSKSLPSTQIDKIDPKSFSVARKRTKEFLRGENLTETGLKDEVEDEITAMQSEKLLSGIIGRTKEPELKFNNYDKAQINLSEQAVIKNDKKKVNDKGEVLHENEISDIE